MMCGIVELITYQYLGEKVIGEQIFEKIIDCISFLYQSLSFKGFKPNYW